MVMSPSIPALWMFIVPALLLVAAAALLRVGLRGRRVDDHPVCRKCGFDLFGLPPEASNCPECGALLREGKAVRVGNRQRRGGMLAAGLVILLLSSGWLGTVGWVAVRGTDWEQYKPVGWVVRDARGGDPVVRDKALTRLIALSATAKLSAEQAAPLADHALGLQAD